MDLTEFTVVGTCQDIEKAYFRLTGVSFKSTHRLYLVLILNFVFSFVECINTFSMYCCTLVYCWPQRIGHSREGLGAKVMMFAMKPQLSYIICDGFVGKTYNTAQNLKRCPQLCTSMDILLKIWFYSQFSP